MRHVRTVSFHALPRLPPDTRRRTRAYVGRQTPVPAIGVFGPIEVKDLGALSLEAGEARQNAATAVERIRSVFERYDQVELLSRLAFATIVGNTPGAPGGPILHQHELETLQAVALSLPRVVGSDPATLPDCVEILIEAAKAHTQSLSRTALADLSDDAARNKIAAVVDRMRTTTHTVRGPRHAYQTRSFCRDLATALDDAFLGSVGVTATDLIDLLESFAWHTNGVLVALRDASARWMGAHDPARALELFLLDNVDHADHPIVRDIRNGIIPPEQISPSLYCVFEQCFSAAFRIVWPNGLPRVARLKHIVEEFALGFGDVEAGSLSHLRLGNPVRVKPFVRSGDGKGTYLFCTQTCLTSLVEMIDEVAARDPALRERVKTFKAQWLEARLQTLVAHAFPSGLTLSNADWHDAEGRNGETDCILVIDQTIGLFEAKSGRITAPAKRGAKDRLRREIDTLIVAPSRQSARLEAELKRGSGAMTFTTADGSVSVSRDNVREVFRVNVLFDTLGPLTAGTRALVEAGFILPGEPIAPTMSIFELETVFDLLPDQVSRLHYLRRRAEIERTLLVEADEFDLIALYLENAFCLGSLTGAEYGVSVYGWSERIAHVYDHEGERSAPPALRRTPFFQTMIAMLERRGQPGWTRFGHHLSSVPYRDQWAILKLRGDVARRARRVKPGQSVGSGAYGPLASGVAIGLCVGKDVSAGGIEAHSRTTAIDISRRSGSEDVIVLYWDVADVATDLRFIATFRSDAGLT